MNIIISASLAALILTTSCGSTKNASSDNEDDSTKQAQTEVTTTAATTGTDGTTANMNTNTNTENGTSGNDQKQDAPKYRLIISFISIGEGTDLEAKTIMDGVVRKWEVEAGKALEVKSIAWGREGEVDYCFMLNELSAENQAKMARELREALNGRQLIQFYEFQPSMHNR